MLTRAQIAAVLDCCRGAEDLFNIDFFELRLADMPREIMRRLRGAEHSQADRIRLKTVAIRIGTLLDRS